MTTWGENLDPASVLQEYPRPQMIREKWINLNGLWEYAVTPVEGEPEKMDGIIFSIGRRPSLCLRLFQFAVHHLFLRWVT